MLAKQIKNPAQNRASKSKTVWSSRWRVRLIDGVSSHNDFEFYLDSINPGISALLRSSAATSVTC